MKSVEILLKGVEHTRALVNITNRYPYTITLRQGRYVVDGKSLLGVCSLQHDRPIQLEAYSDNCASLMQDLEALIC